MSSHSAASRSPWRPFRIKTFRNLTIADFVSDLGTFAQSVGAAWLMVSLSSSPLYISLIQTASTLPFFLLALPAGALGDIVDRRKLVLATESWMLAASIILAVVTIMGLMSPWLLLLLTLVISIGAAIEAPAFRAIIPELVPKEDLTPAITLNGIEFNLARAVGPALAGLIIAAAGVGTAFVVNAASFFGVIAVIFRWKRPVRDNVLPAETVTGATLAAIRYVRNSPEIRVVLLRSGFLMFFSSAFWALLPAVAHSLSKNSIGYGLLLAFFGTGAVLGAVVIQRAQSLISTEAILSYGAVAFGAVVLATGTVHSLSVLCPLMLFGGAAWTVFMSILNTLIQNLAPDWVRARVVAMYLLVFQGGLALGSVVWGVLAERTNIHIALLVAATGVIASLLLRIYFPILNAEVDLTLWNHWPAPVVTVATDPDQGPVLVTVEYVVDQTNVHDFIDAMNRYGRIRRRDGATQWGIYYDAEAPGHYLETFLVHSWGEHLRQHSRATLADRELEEMVNSFVLQPQRASHFIYARNRYIPDQ